MVNLLQFMTDNLLDTIPFLGLYAESHYRFKIPFSRYYKREPELIFDAPWRLKPGQDLTVFLIVKDAHLFPVLLKKVTIDAFHNGEGIASQSWDLEKHIQENQTDFEFCFNNIDLPQGEIEIIPRLSYSIGSRQFEMQVDNYWKMSKPPLRVHVAGDELPRIPGWLHGDTHLHTSLTNDQIEFGASLKVTQKAAELLGLDFITATDHSYDLDDKVDNYLVNDPELLKWKQSRSQMIEMSEANRANIIPGEEISVANNRGSTVHLLHFNDPIYFPGNGDSGEEWPKVNSELSINDVLEQRSLNTVSVGAHTAYRFPWFQRVLLKRGHWESEDHVNPKLDGVQVLCGTPASIPFHDSRSLWIQALLQGSKLGVYGGSDGHGNFNRNWHIRMPMWSMGTHEDQIFGQSRTLVQCNDPNTGDILQAMKARRTALSTGPVGDLTLILGNQSYGIGDTLQTTKNTPINFRVQGCTSQEFGLEMDVSVYAGDMEFREEKLIMHKQGLEKKFNLNDNYNLPASGYIRMEISSDGSRWPGLFMSSPIWIEIL